MPVPTQGRGGHPCFFFFFALLFFFFFLHTRGKVPGHAEACGEPVTLRLVPTLPPPVTTWGPWRRRPKRRPTPAWPLRQAGRQGSAHVRRHARRHARTQAGTTRPGAAGTPAAGSRGPGAGSRARAARRVRERAPPPRAVRRAGARPPPARRSPPARSPASPPVGRGGVWVSNAALPLWAAPGSVPSRREPPRGGGCSCTRRGTDASSRGEGVLFFFWFFFWSVGDVSRGPGRKLATASECWGARRREPPALGRGPPRPNAGGRARVHARALHSPGAHPAAGRAPDRAQKSPSVRGCC